MFMRCTYDGASSSGYFATFEDRNKRSYCIKLPEDIQAHGLKGKDVVLDVIGKEATFVCADAENCVYIISPYKNGRQQKSGVIKFVDQDILFRWLVTKENLLQETFFSTDKTITFNDKDKTSFNFSVHRLVIIEGKDERLSSKG